MTEAPSRAPFIVAVVVACDPDQVRFAAVLAAVDTQVDVTVVVDNARGAGLEATRFGDRIERIDLHGNAGVASAQNAGIERALALGATHVLLLDHDSIPGPDMTQRLLRASDALRAQGARVAAVGADYRDARHDAESPFIAMGFFRYRRVVAKGNATTVPVSFLISAGTLIATDAIEAVGLMDEKLFIDYVDVEWCLRASIRHWHCFGVPGACLDHRLGDAPLQWRPGGKPIRLWTRTIPSRSPTRHYYLFRNGCWLILRSPLPLRWKLIETKRLVASFLAFASFASGRRAQVAAMVRGVFDGMCGRMGAARRPAPSSP